MKIDLLPCPFCGTEPFINKKDASFSVVCPSCLVERIGTEIDTAIERWNTRHQLPIKKTNK